MINKMQLTLNRSINRNPQKLRILTFCTHEGYQTLLGETGHEFYMLSGPDLKRWDFHTRPLPTNHYLYTKPYDSINWTEEFDLILCQNREQHFGKCKELSFKFGIPIIVLDHTEPPPNAPKFSLQQLRSMRGHTHVYITEHNKQSWGDESGIVINHGINTDVFKGWNGQNQSGVSVVNLFPERDIFCGWTVWQQVTNKIPVKLFGFNPSLNTKSINNVNELVSELAQARFYLNTSQHSPVPMSMLEAMSVGCPVVTTDKQEISKIIEPGVNGFISNNVDDLISACELLLNDHDLASRMGQNARQTIVDRFNLNKFCEEWNRVFMNTYLRNYTWD